MNSITGTIDRVIYHKVSDSPHNDSGNKFLISSFSYEKDGLTEQCIVKGELNSVIFGWNYRLYGDWKDSDRGKAFVFESFEPLIPKSNEGMADFLARSVPEVGKVRARLIIDEFGQDSFKILKTDPSRLREVKGITPKAREAIEAYFASENGLEVDPVDYSLLYDLLSPIRPPRRVITSLLKNFGSNARQFVTDNPYSLLDFSGMGWQRVDKFATEILKYDKGGIERHKKAIAEVLTRNSEYGHTRIDRATLHVDASNLLGDPLRKDSIQEAIKDGMIYVDENKDISLMKLYKAELAIADEVRRLQSGNQDLGFDLNDDILEDEQKLIPEMIRNNPVSIISGVPGSGKSTSISVIIKRLVEHGIKNILVVAPTGKAAKRNDELIRNLNLPVEIPCSTIHRALGGQLSSESEEGVPEDEARMNRGRNKFTFEYGKENRLPYSIYIVDESSMVDISLGAMFLEAIPDNARVVFVGDRHQLPSVGPGSFLRDLISSGVPSVTLDKPRRNSAVIAHACYFIKNGKNPEPERLSKELGMPSNWTHREIQRDEDILNCIIDIHTNYINRYSNDLAKQNLQVISPEKKGILGCFNLNKMLSTIVNPGDAPLISAKNEEVSLRDGDKVVRTKNGVVKSLIINNDHEGFIDETKTIIFNGIEYYLSQCYVVNGDAGEVIGFKGSNIVARFSNPDRVCLLPKSDSKLSLAYAMTVHRCQGSGFPVVIVPLTDFYWNTRDNVGLFSRELVYTAMSRPIERMITVGRIAELHKAVSRITINQRKTRLKEMLENVR